MERIQKIVCSHFDSFIYSSWNDYIEIALTEKLDEMTHHRMKF